MCYTLILILKYWLWVMYYLLMCLYMFYYLPCQILYFIYIVGENEVNIVITHEGNKPSNGTWPICTHSPQLYTLSGLVYTVKNKRCMSTFHFWDCRLSFLRYQDENLEMVSQQYTELGQTAQMCRLNWLYTDGKDWSLSDPAYMKMFALTWNIIIIT